MIRRDALPELLSPAGNYECLVGAIAGGADAVYIGGQRFGARAYAENFDTGAIQSAVTLCKLNGVRLYVTVNTLIADREMAEAVNYVRELYSLGVDAVIVADVGLMREIRENIPDMEIHASTQASVHNCPGAEEMVKLGCSRVVPARELSLSDIRTLTEGTGCEIEVFLHGALCVCHSGQCLFSSLVGGRSGNRGECAQPCRLPFTTKRGKGYPLSLKDLCLASYIPELIDSGVSSLKIEGRMKSPSYVYTVTKIYRRLLDEGRACTAEELDILRRAFSRDGFTDGYFTGKLDTGMTGVRSEQDKMDSRELEIPPVSLPRHRVRASVKIVAGEMAEMTLTDGIREVTVYSDVPDRAENHPLTPSDVCSRLSKMGNTPLFLDPCDIDLTLGEGLNLSPAKLNGLRRLATDAFLDFGRDKTPDYEYKPEAPERDGEICTAQFFSESGFMATSDELLDNLTGAFVPLFSSDEALKRAGGVYLPPVIFDSEIASVRAGLKKARELGISRVMADNIGHFPMAREQGFEIFGGFRLNITNSASRQEYARLGARHALLSPELTLPQARDIGGGVITYGRIPLMLTERCFIKDNFGCESCSDAALVDRKGESFPMIREHGHRNLILNSGVTYMGDRTDELKKYKIRHTHLLFTVEDGEEIGRIFAAIEDGTTLGESVRRVGRRDTAAASKLRDDTAVNKSRDIKSVFAGQSSVGKAVGSVKEKGKAMRGGGIGRSVRDGNAQIKRDGKTNLSNRTGGGKKMPTGRGGR